MSRRSIRHGGVVACDMPGCRETYTTYSVVTLARGQAARAGWHRVRGSTVRDQGGHLLASGSAKVDLCPEHGPAPRMAGAGSQ